MQAAANRSIWESLGGNDDDNVYGFFLYNFNLYNNIFQTRPRSGKPPTRPGLRSNGADGGDGLCSDVTHNVTS